MVLVHGRLVVEYLTPGQPLPLGPAGRLYQRRHAVLEQVAALVHVDDVEDDALVLLHVVHGEVEPEAVPRIARVRPQEQIVLELAY